MTWEPLPARVPGCSTWELRGGPAGRVHVTFHAAGPDGWTLLLGWPLGKTGGPVNDFLHLNLYARADEAEAFRRAERVVAALAL